jgi:hypothetical protein
MFQKRIYVCVRFQAAVAHRIFPCLILQTEILVLYYMPVSLRKLYLSICRNYVRHINMILIIIYHIVLNFSTIISQLIIDFMCFCWSFESHFHARYEEFHHVDELETASMKKLLGCDFIYVLLKLVFNYI